MHNLHLHALPVESTRQYFDKKSRTLPLPTKIVGEYDLGKHLAIISVWSVLIRGWHPERRNHKGSFGLPVPVMESQTTFDRPTHEPDCPYRPAQTIHLCRAGHPD